MRVIQAESSEVFLKGCVSPRCSLFWHPYNQIVSRKKLIAKVILEGCRTAEQNATIWLATLCPDELLSESKEFCLFFACLFFALLPFYFCFLFCFL